MYAWEQIQNVIEYIEEHIGEEINIDNLAKNACLSKFYFQRMFHRLVKKPVAEYIKYRRMAIALDLLKNKGKSILDIALELGFKTHEHFTTTFKNIYGITPSEYRKNPQPFNRMTKPELVLHYISADEGVPIITNGIVLEMNRQTFESDITYTGFLKQLPLAYGDGLGCEPGEDILGALWQKAHAYKQSNECTMISPEEIGVVLPCTRAGYYEYFAGICVKNDFEAEFDEVSHFVRPKGEYIVCTFEAENFEILVMDTLYKAQDYLFSTWLPNKGLIVENYCIEQYENHTPDTTKMQLLLKVK